MDEKKRIDIPNGKVGLLLSITVLDHISNDQDFESELGYFRGKISEQGVFLLVEYALDRAES